MRLAHYCSFYGNWWPVNHSPPLIYFQYCNDAWIDCDMIHDAVRYDGNGYITPDGRLIMVSLIL